MNYEYIHFRETPTKGKTSAWECCNNKSGTVLGKIKWHGPWRQYCYFPVCQAVYSAGCLKDITSFLKERMEERKKK